MTTPPGHLRERPQEAAEAPVRLRERHTANYPRRVNSSALSPAIACALFLLPPLRILIPCFAVSTASHTSPLTPGGRSHLLAPIATE